MNKKISNPYEEHRQVSQQQVAAGVNNRLITVSDIILETSYDTGIKRPFESSYHMGTSPSPP